MTKCPDCREERPADIHTCSPQAEQPAQQPTANQASQHSSPELPAGMARYKCACCGDPFLARVADRKRGWARFCSKSCKAIKQEKRTGQHKDYLSRRDGGLCHPSFEDGEVQ